MKQPRTADMLVEDMNKNGTVKLSIHPEHFSEIKKMFYIVEKLEEDRKPALDQIRELQEKLSIKNDEVRLAAKKAWARVEDSYDDTMNAVKKACGASEIILEGKVLIFKSHDIARKEIRELRNSV